MKRNFEIHDAIESAYYINCELNKLIEESIRLEAKFVKEGRLNDACEERRWRIDRIATESLYNKYINGFASDCFV